MQRAVLRESYHQGEATDVFHASTHLDRAKLMYDVIIIGSGFGGAIPAYEFSRAGQKVCLVERGPWRDTPAVKKQGIKNRAAFPKGAGFLHRCIRSISHPRLANRSLRLNKNGLFELFLNKDIDIICSSGVGGGSHVYGGLHARPSNKHYWDNLAEGLSSDIMEEHYLHILHQLQSQKSPQHQDVNTFHCENDFVDLPKDQQPSWGYSNIHSKEKEQPGLSQVDFSQEGMFGSESGNKVTLDCSHILPAMALGLHVQSNCEALSIEKGKKSYTVHIKHLDKNTIDKIQAKKIILAAGCLNTFKLLKTSVNRQQIPDIASLGDNFTSNADMMALFPVSDKGGDQTSSGPYQRIMYAKDKPLGPIYLQAGISGLSAIPLPLFIKKRLREKLFIAAMGIDEVGGGLSLIKERVHVDYQESSNPVIGEIRRSFKKISALSGVKLREPSKLTTVHPLGGASISNSHNNGVVTGLGEMHQLPGVYITDASVLPSALGTPPSLSIAAWSRHVAINILLKED